MIYEYELDANSMIYFEVELVDDSFDHAFGTKNSRHFVVKDAQIKTCFGDIEFDMTSYFEDEHPTVWETFKGLAIDSFMQSLRT